MRRTVVKVLASAWPQPRKKPPPRGSKLASRAPTPAVYVAGLGPQMMKLTGWRTAGTVTWMAGPRTLSEHDRPALRGAVGD
jgi:5,10-methylenetetrahydromethanopterin reductase